MNTNGWDTISVLNIAQVNNQLAQRLADLVMTFQASWVDGFAGAFTADGSFGPWSITGGSDTDLYLTIPVSSGTITPQTAGASATDVAGMTFTFEVGLEWIPSTVTPQGKDLQFAISGVTAPNAVRQPGEIAYTGSTDPGGTGFGAALGQQVAQVLSANRDKITYVFAQTGVVDTASATWLMPVQSTYSFHQPLGGTDQYLAILSVTDGRDISGLNANIDDGIASGQYPLSFVISGDLFLQNVIMPALPGAFDHASASSFAFASPAITLANQFNLDDVQAGAIDYTPTVTSMTIAINGNAVSNATSGSVDLKMPDAYLDFSATTNNVLVYDPAHQTFSFQQDPNPSTSTDSHVPWYDYLLTLGAIGAAITAIVLAAVESGLASSLSGSALAGSLAAAPATTVAWQGLDQISIASGALDDCFLLLAGVS